jgi:hypothetical protein
MDGGAQALRCDSCGHLGADIHTLLCPHCLIALPPYFRAKAERAAIQAALLRQHLIEEPMGAIRWTEQQYRDFLRKQPQAPEVKKPPGRPPRKASKSSLTFTLPLTPIHNAYLRMHWQEQRKLLKQLGQTFAQQIPLAAGIPFVRAKVEIIRYSAQEPDPDNLTGSAKPILDAMQVPRVNGKRKLHPYGAYIIENDNRDCIELVVSWEHAPAKHGKVVVIVTPRP